MLPDQLPFPGQEWNIPIEIYSRCTILNIDPKKPHLIISACEPHKELAVIPRNENTLDILYQKYTDQDYADRLNEEKLFSLSLASQIWQTILGYRNEIEMVICQCDGGISRSSATAAALSRIINGDDRWVFNCGAYNPNKLVYITLLNVFHLKYGSRL